MQVAVDEALITGVERSTTEVILMPNGCVCCKVRGDLVEGLKKFCAEATDDLDGIIIECSGLAQCGPVAQTFFLDEYVQAHLQLDAVVCVCDCTRLPQLLADGGSSEASSSSELLVVHEQLAMADVVLLNKASLVDEATLQAVQQHVCVVSPGVSTHAVTQHDGVLSLDTSLICAVDAFSLEKALTLEEHFAEGGHHHSPHLHASLGFRSVGIQFSDRQLDWVQTNLWLQKLCSEHSDELCRFKGVLWCEHEDQETRVVVQGAYGQFEWNDAWEWAEGEERHTRMVFIGALSEVLEGKLNDGLLGNCVAAAAEN
eukprot:TRINITY_DN15561_c0_g1_i3.p1 TRINITY_DN15561_c0_g1~~TRINITY_DN15561_c0_g1_i3.p1  ORF type:complete len:314 (-),score=87.06 TRINITY_DN15561_c0_g1_i3:76-1017(-)